ncbi:hypothetical protein [Streptomyces sp. ISL-94]|uniref:hypothetical protein n=1 Tax=Streptomyces sp. ISL-94 TaxID=2819190 RepID=UPI001BE7DE9F|nr:hypothetical protein [Streptomyces sp. ISL-94]MBT2480482.1 hypothetical protein [Streptomyces sp. ISL-94]
MEEAPAPVPPADAPESAPPRDTAEAPAEQVEPIGPDSDAAPFPTEAPAPDDSAPDPTDAPEPAEVSERAESPGPVEQAHQAEGPRADEAPDPAEAARPAETHAPAGRGFLEADEAPAPAPVSDDAPEPPEAVTRADAVSLADDPDSAPDPVPPHDAPEAPAEPAELGEVSEAPGSDEAPAADDAAPDPRDAPARHDRVGVDDDAVEGGVLDKLKQLAGRRRQETDGPERLTGTVDHPAFQDPTRSPNEVPDRYGTPLDRADGTRTPLFDGDPSREQTEQGALEDCGIIATLGAVAGHRPEAIRECVREAEDGNYAVKLHEAKFNHSRDRYEPTGREINLTVTPDLPVFDDRPGEPAFADSVATGAAWAPVLEKAIAGSDQAWDRERRDRWAERQKMRGAPEVPEGYVRLNQGSGPKDRAELLTQLTGQPAATWDFPKQYDHDGHSPDKQLMGDIRQRLAEGKPVLVGTHSEREVGGPLSNDLHPAHAYEVTEVDDQGEIHLRNPWNALDPKPLTLKQFNKYIRPRYTTLE